jgi:hypothetical protein
MNEGFAAAAPADWLLFWGSDDWAATPTVLAEAMAALEPAAAGQLDAFPLVWPDLLVCRGRYAVPTSAELGRSTAFRPLTAPPTLLAGDAYRRALLLGSTPPHQATLFGPGARSRLACYAPGFRLSADLDYFLQLSQFAELRVKVLALELVHMAPGGVSGVQHRRRLQEVRFAYRRAFGWRWPFPFLLRYAQRLLSARP